MRTRLAIVCAAVLVAATVTTGHAAETLPGELCEKLRRDTQIGDTPLPLPCQELDQALAPFIGDAGVPPRAVAETAVAWSMEPGATVPTFLPPYPPTSHPANWACFEEHPSPTAAIAHCWPTDPPDPGTGEWGCYTPFVDVTITGPTLSAVAGTTSCGYTATSCTASTGDVGAGHCTNTALPQAPVPLSCLADWSAAVPGSSWTVRCSPSNW